MKCTVRRLTDWELVADLARRTMWKEGLGHEPTSDWKRRMLLAAHSPVYSLWFRIDLDEIPSWVSVHLVRHHVGVTPYVSSQRPDRSPTGASRHDLPQDAPVNATFVANAMAIMDISRKRLCSMAAKETREAWKAVVEELRKIGEVELADACVPECVHQGYRCPELKGCGRCPSIWGEMKHKLDNAEPIR